MPTFEPGAKIAIIFKSSAAPSFIPIPDPQQGVKFAANVLKADFTSDIIEDGKVVGYVVRLTSFEPPLTNVRIPREDVLLIGEFSEVVVATPKLIRP